MNARTTPLALLAALFAGLFACGDSTPVVDRPGGGWRSAPAFEAPELAPIDRSGSVELEVGCRSPAVLSAGAVEIEVDARWVDRASPGCPDYVLGASLTLRGAHLVIEPGVEIEIAPGARLRIESGWLTAVGEVGAEIELRGSEGRWGGLELIDVKSAELGHLRVTATAANEAAIRVEGASTVSVEAVEVRDALGLGVWLGDEVAVPAWRDNVFTDVGAAPVSLPLGLIAALETESDVHAGARPRPYEVRGDHLARSTTFARAGVPYRLVGAPGADRVLFDGTLVVREGAVLEVGDGLGLVLASGRAAFTGRPEAPVVIRGAAGADRWAGLWVAGGAKVFFEATDLIGGGLAGRPWVPHAEPATLTVTADDEITRASLRDVRILEPQGAALWIESGRGVDVRCPGLATSGRVVPDCS